MQAGDVHFLSMMGFSFVVLAGALLLVLRSRPGAISRVRIALVVAVISIGGMLWGRLGAQAGWPWALYLLPPMAVTILLPPLAFRMTARESFAWVALALVAGPFVHVVFSILLGWGEFIPVWRLPSLRE